MDERTEQGILLKQTREAKGIPLEKVHEDTKIPLDALRAIEEGYTVRTLTPFYYRGFVKIYARYLNLDLKKVLKDYEPEKLPQTLAIQEGRSSPFSEKIDSALTPEVMQKIVKIFVILFVVILFMKIGGCMIKKFRTPRQGRKVLATTHKAEKKIVKKAKKKSIKKKMPVVAPKEFMETKVISSMPEQKGNVIVTVRARRNSWLRVAVDGRVVFQSVMKRGTVETWRAAKKVELAGKNISDLEFELNGKVIGTLGRKDRHAKKVVFTKNGFSVKQ